MTDATTIDKSALKTGDLILCDNLGHKGLGIFGWIIKYFSYSDYSHIGMVVRDPQFTKEPLSGLYFWQAGFSDFPDAEDHVKKNGVQLTPLDEFISSYSGKLYVRTIQCPDIDTYDSIFNDTHLREVHDAVYDKHYDLNPSDWIDFYRQKDRHPQKTSSFVCSSLIGYIYTKLGLLPASTDWTLIEPRYFSSENTQLALLHDSHLHLEREIK